eukprot:scaffold375_cov210-Pinguiococcus_pyrenoidosus.AAC.1
MKFCSAESRSRHSTAARRNSSRPVSCASPFLAPARAPFNMLAISQMCGCGGNAEAREAEQPAVRQQD